METIEALRAREEQEKRSPALALGVICIGCFMVILDATVTNVALPSIGRGLHGSVTGLQWVVDAYTLSLAGLLLTGGALAERLGGRRIFAFGLVVFGAASAACGLAPTLGVLVAARFAQGVGAAALVPSSLLLLQAAFTDRRAGSGMALTMPAATASVMEAAPPDRGGIASGVVNAARQAGGVLGVAILGSLVSVRSGFTGGLRAGLIIAAIAFLVGAAVTFRGIAPGTHGA